MENAKNIKKSAAYPKLVQTLVQPNEYKLVDYAQLPRLGTKLQ